MKEILFIIIVVITMFHFAAKGGGKPPAVAHPHQTEWEATFEKRTGTVVYQGCEYLTYNNYTTGSSSTPTILSITHKGNCNNPIHNHPVEAPTPEKHD